jgi:hypothetical protein
LRKNNKKIFLLEKNIFRSKRLPSLTEFGIKNQLDLPEPKSSRKNNKNLVILENTYKIIF